MGLVCRAPGVIGHTNREVGEPLVKGKRVTGFSNSEEEAVQLTEIVFFRFQPRDFSGETEEQQNATAFLQGFF
jgi:putative intracellular protease/amidase